MAYKNIIYNYLCDLNFILSNIKTMAQTNLHRKGHVYEVKIDSTLGIQITNYASRCTRCNEAVRDFIQSIEHKYSFPVHITDKTEYCLSDDCDAGGLIAIVVNKSDFSQLSLRASVIWDSLPATGDENALYVFPRIEANTHFIKYGQAVRLLDHQAPDWEFMPPTMRDKANGKKLHVLTYDEVRNRIGSSDREALVSKPGQTPSASVRLAIGTQYKLNVDSLPDCPERSGIMTQNFIDAVSLYKEWMSIPNVPANALARTLCLKSPSADGKEDAERCFCEWRTDADNKRYLIYTGLVSSLAEMRETIDPSALAVFGL